MTNSFNSFEALAQSQGITKEDAEKRAQMEEMWKESTNDYIRTPMSVKKEDRNLFRGFYKKYSALMEDEDALDEYMVYCTRDGEDVKAFSIPANAPVYGKATALASATKAICLTFVHLLKATGYDQERTASLMNIIISEYKGCKYFKSSTVTKVVGDRVESTTTSSAPVDTPISVEHTFESSDSGRHVDTKSESSEEYQENIDEPTLVAEEPTTESSPVDERIKVAKAEQLKHAKANAKAIDDSKSITADILKQLEEMKQMLADAKEEKHKAEEEARVVAEVEEITKATKDADDATQAALDEQRKIQDDAMRMLLEMKKELEALKNS